MKKKNLKLHERLLMLSWIIPIPVMLIITALLNYWLGTVMTDINSMYSNITNMERDTFIIGVVKLIIVWLGIKLVNSIVTRISNHRILDTSFMKWIEKLTYSKVSSISTMGTGAIQNAINTIVGCDKMIINSVIGVLPFIAPFFIICKREYDIAGIAPVMINILSIACFIWLNYAISNLKSNEKSAKAGNKMKSVTTDCILNSKSVKYFQKEKWSVDLQYSTQKEIFIDFLNINKAIICNLFSVIMWIPTILNVYLCWGSKTTVLFIVMTDYAIHNISGYISDIMDVYTEKQPLEDILCVSNVKFKYSPEALTEFSVNGIIIRKGHRYCITGKSGFGKSTFIKLITKTVEPTSGTIAAIDCIYMFAESQMFNQSIFDNIALGDETVTMEEVKEILKALDVEVDYDLNEPIGEKGEKLSTGQIQRINLARVLVYARRHPGVIIALDEVTSALDEVTSVKCINYLADEFERLGTTLLYVSNKSDYKNTNLITDNIYVIRDGNRVYYIQDTLPLAC